MSSEQNRIKILYFGVYNPAYSRNRVLIKALELNGVVVEHCRVKLGRLGALKLLCKYLKNRYNYDVMLVGFPGQEVMFLAKILSLRKPIIFDAFTSHYGGYILDRRYYSRNSLRAKYYRFLDKYSCKLADLVLLDTQAHIDFFIQEYNLPRSKFYRSFVGTDSEVFYPREKSHKEGFLVHFHGKFQPLQGTRYIAEAAKILESDGIKFQIIGRGQDYNEARRLADVSSNITWIDSVTYDRLPEIMSRADLCLGIFGDTPKTELVIPNKIFEAIAIRKPVLTSDTPAIREAFSKNQNIFLCQRASSNELVRAIRELKQNPDLLSKVGQVGYDLFQNRFQEKVIGEKLVEQIKKLL